MSKAYYRPIVQMGPSRPNDALPLAGGACWFTHVELITRDERGVFIPAARVPANALDALVRPRPDVVGLDMSAPRIMGILNVTPDSFSDGGRFSGAASALRHAKQMAQSGADIIDIGGESTRPGALEVPAEAELARTVPVIRALKDGVSTPISIDTRKAAVAKDAIKTGADLVNDVSGFTFDPELAPFCAEGGLPVCVMHAQGDPETMQENPQYENVLLDVYDFLEERIAALEALGLPPSKIIVDPGIGFGKSLEHNLTLLTNISIFHGLGCAILLGVSRKGMIRTIGKAEDPQERAPGSIAVGLAAVAQGVQILRVHDVAQTRQALLLWQAVTRGQI